MPRLPSALGLGGAKRDGRPGLDTDPPMRSDSPNSPNPLSPPPHLAPARRLRTSGWRRRTERCVSRLASRRTSRDTWRSPSRSCRTPVRCSRNGSSPMQTSNASRASTSRKISGFTRWPMARYSRPRRAEPPRAPHAARCKELSDKAEGAQMIERSVGGASMSIKKY
eukprot:scaffold189_cov118-Isochrysis_galbana.AAC.5